MPKKILVAEDAPVTRDTLSVPPEQPRLRCGRVRGRERRPGEGQKIPAGCDPSGFPISRDVRLRRLPRAQLDPACSRIPILFLVAHESAEELMTRSVPAAEFLVSKPFMAHDLIQRVTQVLDGATR